MAVVTLPAAAAASPDVQWVDVDLSDGTIYGTSAIVTARTATTLTIDPGQAAASYLDDSPDNRGDYWWATQAVDLSDWVDGPCLLLLDLIRADAPAEDGNIIGICFHNTADPTASTAFNGVLIQSQEGYANPNGKAYAINDWGQTGGWGNLWAKRQRAVMEMLMDTARLEMHSWRSAYLGKDGLSTADASLYLTSYKNWDISGGLWFSVIAGAYQPGSPAGAPATHTPLKLRYAVVPFGVNP